MADTRTARRQPQAAWYSRFMVSASSAWVPALAPAGQGPSGASAGTQAEDALTMKKLYQACQK